MQKQFKNSVLAVTVLTLLAANTLLPCFARSAMEPSKTSSASAKTPPIPNGTSAAGGIATHTSKPNKASSSNSSTGKHSVGQEVQPAAEPSQPPPGPFKNIFFTGDSLQFKLSRAGGVFIAPLTATINGLAFPVVVIKKAGIKLTLAGSPGGSTLGSIFPDGATAATRITNGDGLILYLVIRRQGDSVSVLPPSVEDISPRHGSPGSIITISGSNFSPTPDDNILTYTTSDGKEIPLSAIESTETRVTALVPPILISAEPTKFYSGSIELRIQSAPGYASSPSMLTIDNLTNNSKPVGVVSQEFSQQLGDMTTQLEDIISPLLAESGTDPELIKKVRELPHAAIDDFRTLVDDALSGRPQVLLVDIDGDKNLDKLTIDRNTIDILERLMVSMNISTEITSLTANLSNGLREVQRFAVSADCNETTENLLIVAAESLNTLERILDRFLLLEIEIVLAAAVVGCVATLPVGCVSGAVAAAAAALAAGSVVSSILHALAFGFSIAPVVLSRIDSAPLIRFISVGGKTDYFITGKFKAPTGQFLTGFIADLVLNIAGDKLARRLRSLFRHIRPSEEKIIEIVKEVSERITGFLVEKVLKRFDALANAIVPNIERDIPLSSLRTHIEPLTISELAVDNLCNGILGVTGIRETPGVRFRARSDFPRVESEASRYSGFMEVRVNRNAPIEPLVSDISPESAPVGSFPVTINGNNFDLNTAEVAVFGPGCEGGCFVRGADLISRTPNRIVARLTINNPSNFLIGVSNGGRNGTLSNLKTLTVTRSNQSPVAGFTMSADGLTKHEGETLRLITTPGQAIDVSFSADRSYDPDSGSLRYSWQVSTVPKSTSRQFTFGLGPGTHQISLTVTDDEGSQASTNGTVVVTTQESSQPLLSDISPVAASVGIFNLTINGTNINPAIAEVGVSGPGCSSAGCVVPNANLLTKSATQIVVPLQINNPGSFIVTVRNGGGCWRSFENVEM